jgi:hypothetical protein
VLADDDMRRRLVPFYGSVKKRSDAVRFADVFAGALIFRKMSVLIALRMDMGVSDQHASTRGYRVFRLFRAAFGC